LCARIKINVIDFDLNMPQLIQWLGIDIFNLFYLCYYKTDNDSLDATIEMILFLHKWNFILNNLQLEIKKSPN
jgi:hypothetical protein